MCCIIICEKERVSFEVLWAADASNSDGLGIAWVSKGAIRWRKGLDLDDCFQLAATIPLPYVIHARLATVGGEDKKLAHPFPIERSPRLQLKGKAKSVLFHNGHVSEWRALLSVAGMSALPKNPKGWSDSRAIAHVVAVRGASVLRELTGNRFAVLDKDKGVIRFGSWLKKEGCFLSSDPIAYGYAYGSSFGRYDVGSWKTKADTEEKATGEDKPLKALPRPSVEAVGTRWRYATVDGKVVRSEINGHGELINDDAEIVDPTVEFEGRIARMIAEERAGEDAEAMDLAEALAVVDRPVRPIDLLDFDPVG